MQEQRRDEQQLNAEDNADRAVPMMNAGTKRISNGGASSSENALVEGLIHAHVGTCRLSGAGAGLELCMQEVEAYSAMNRQEHQTPMNEPADVLWRQSQMNRAIEQDSDRLTQRESNGSRVELDRVQ